MTPEDGRIVLAQPEIEKRPAAGLQLAVWCTVAAFGTYFCMYGFRKPFTAAAFADDSFLGVGYKSILVISQVMGYMVSKFIGIKVVAELPPERRVLGILLLVGVAQLALLLFGLVPAPYGAICLFLNGLPLGMVFGLVLGFLEGRRHTEALVAGLCASFILADGVTKSVGAFLLKWGVAETWMPAAAGLVFALPLCGFAWMLTRIPTPTVDDVQARSERLPMSRADRRRMFRTYAPGLIALILAYLMITVLRSVRADFQPEIWKGLATTVDPGAFAISESLVALGSMVLFGSVVFIRGNRRAFFLSLLLTVLGSVLIGLAAIGAYLSLLPGMLFMVLVGLGIYLPYVAVHTTVFERFIAMTRDRGNIGYLLYLADAFGYLGYVAVVLAKNIWGGPGEFLSFFLLASVVAAIATILLWLTCWIYFARHPALARGS